MSTSTKPAKTIWRRFREAQSGTTAVIFGLSAVTVVAVAGATLDMGRSNSTATELQHALDGAVLAGVSSSLVASYQIDEADRFFEANAKDLAELTKVTFKRQDEKLVGTAGMPMETTFLRLVGFDKLDIGVASAATAAQALEPMCVMAMHPTRKHTLELKDSVSIVGADCIFYGNSNHPNDVIDPHTLNNFVTARAVLTIGGGHHELQNVKPPPEFGTVVIADPLVAMPIPAAGACSGNPPVYDGVAQTINEGVWCDGLEIKNGANITFNPGTYFIKGGKFEISSSTVQGKDVTIVLADNKASLDWEDSTVKLSAQRSDPHKGLVIIGVRQETTNYLTNSTVDLHGAVYMPNGAFEWTNSGTPRLVN